MPKEIKEKIRKEFEETFKTELSRDLTVLFDWWWKKLDQREKKILGEIEYFERDMEWKLHKEPFIIVKINLESLKQKLKS